MEYSKDINSLLGNTKSSTSSLIEDPKTFLKVNLPLYLPLGYLSAITTYFFWMKIANTVEFGS